MKYLNLFLLFSILISTIYTKRSLDRSFLSKNFKELATKKMEYSYYLKAKILANIPQLNGFSQEIPVELIINNKTCDDKYCDHETCVDDLFNYTHIHSLMANRINISQNYLLDFGNDELLKGVTNFNFFTKKITTNNVDFLKSTAKFCCSIYVFEAILENMKNLLKSHEISRQRCIKTYEDETMSSAKKAIAQHNTSVEEFVRNSNYIQTISKRGYIHNENDDKTSYQEYANEFPTHDCGKKYKLEGDDTKSFKVVFSYKSPLSKIFFEYSPFRNVKLKGTDSDFNDLIVDFTWVKIYTTNKCNEDFELKWILLDVMPKNVCSSGLHELRVNLNGSPENFNPIFCDNKRKKSSSITRKVDLSLYTFNTNEHYYDLQTLNPNNDVLITPISWLVEHDNGNNKTFNTQHKYENLFHNINKYNSIIKKTKWVNWGVNSIFNDKTFDFICTNDTNKTYTLLILGENMENLVPNIYVRNYPYLSGKDNKAPPFSTFSCSKKCFDSLLTETNKDSNWDNFNALMIWRTDMHDTLGLEQGSQLLSPLLDPETQYGFCVLEHNENRLVSTSIICNREEDCTNDVILANVDQQLLNQSFEICTDLPLDDEVQSAQILTNRFVNFVSTSVPILGIIKNFSLTSPTDFTAFVTNSVKKCATSNGLCQNIIGTQDEVLKFCDASRSYDRGEFCVTCFNNEVGMLATRNFPLNISCHEESAFPLLQRCVDSDCYFSQKDKRERLKIYINGIVETKISFQNKLTKIAEYIPSYKKNWYYN